MTKKSGARYKGQGTRRAPLLSVLLFLVPCTLPLAPLSAGAVSVDESPILTLFVDQMVERHGFAREQLTNWMSQAEIKDDIIAAVYRPKEGLPWYEYRKLFVNDERMRRGLEFWRRNAKSLAAAARQHGVPPEIIAAIIGVETLYGRQGGGYRVLDALVTRTLRYPERSEFFRGELVEFLLLTRDLGVDPLAVKGSYAGAMGIPQFISSSYRRYAVDFNGDGRRDLNNVDDAIGSVANYLRQHGWRRDEPIVGEVRLEGSMYAWLENNGAEPRISLQQLSRYGILPVAGTDDRQLAALLTYQGEDGPLHRLGYNNFYVITRYNRSSNYAMAVVELAQALQRLYYAQ